MKDGMLVCKRITQVSLKPTLRGLYFYIAERADVTGRYYFSYEEARKVIPIKFYAKYTSTLEMLDLVYKDYKLYKLPNGITGKRNRINLIVKEPVIIPNDVINTVKEKELKLKEQGIYYTLYLMANKYGEIHSTVKDLSAYFDMAYQHFSGHLRKLEDLDLIQREKGRVIVNALENVYV